MIRAGVDVVRLNFSHGTHERKARGHREDSQSEPRRAQAAVHPGRPAGAQDPHHAAQRSSARAAQGRPPAHHHAARRPGHGFAGGHHIQDPRRERRAGLAHSALRRPDRAARARGRRRRRSVRHRQRRHAGRNKGINLPGVLVRTPSLTEKDSVDLEFALNHGVDAIAVSFVRTRRGRHPGAQSRSRARRQYLDHRQAGKAAGRRASRQHPASGRRHHGGPRRSGRGSAAGEGSRHSEAHHPPRRRVFQAGDHRDADAGIDDREPAAHARRSLRRGQRHLRRHRRRHALRRVGRRQVPGRVGGHDGAHRHRDRAAHEREP